jgi:tRNA pseudouridine38-40 synthase
MRNIKLVLEYDGTDFNGWQFQPDQRTVQGEVEAGLSRLTQETVKTFCAGRTDTGVHALGQVINFHYQGRLPVQTLLLGGNALLPRDVRILAAEEVAENFHSRYSARSRRYRYHISTETCAVGRQYCWYLPQALDVNAMDLAVQDLLGEHDFESFCQAGSGLDHYRCFVQAVAWRRQDRQIVFDITANRFVHNMVRIIVGTSVNIGRGYTSASAMKQILNEKDRKTAGPTVPAHGLFLVQVGY